MKNKLIQKHLTPADPLVLQNDNTLVIQPVLPMSTANIDWITIANNKIDKSIQEQPHSEVVRHPKRPKTQEEAMTIMFDPRKAPQTSTTQVIGLSPVDPVGEFVVGNAVLGTPVKLLGKGLLYGAGRAGNNWARAKIISSNMKVSPYRFNRGYYTIGHDWDPGAFYHYERNILPKTLGGTRLHPRPSNMGESKIWLSKGKPWLEGDKTLYKIPVDKVKTQSSKIIDPNHAEFHIADEIDLLQDGVEISYPISIPDKGGFLTINGNKKFYVPTTKTTQPQPGLTYYITGNSSSTISPKTRTSVLIKTHNNKPMGGEMHVPSTNSPKMVTSEPFDYEAFNKQIMDVFAKRAKVRGGFDISDIVEANGNTDEGVRKIAEKMLSESGWDVSDYDYPIELIKEINYIKGLINGGPGMGWYGMKIAHVDPNKILNLYGPIGLGYVRAHEFGHALRIPFEPIPSGVLNFSGADPSLVKYFTKGNNAEIAERFSQVLNFHGITDGRRFTPDEWLKMWQEYIANIGKTTVDNNITTNSFLPFIRKENWSKLCEWANNHRNVLGLGIPTTVIGVNNTNGNK